MDLLPKKYKRFIILVSILTSLAVTLAFNLLSYGFPVFGFSLIEPEPNPPPAIIANPTPAISRIELSDEPIIVLNQPPAIPINTGFTLTVHGQRFTPASQIIIGALRPGTSTIESTDTLTPTDRNIENTILSVRIPENYLLTNKIRTFRIWVFNPGPGGGRSPTFRLFRTTNPQITSIVSDPNPASSNGEFTLTISGRGFAPNSFVRISGSYIAQLVTVNGSTQVTATFGANTVPAATNTAGTRLVVVLFRPPQAGNANLVTSNALPIIIR